MAPERRAVLLLLGLAVGGQGLRLWLARPGAPPGEAALIPPPAGSTPAAHRDSSLALARPLRPGERIDLDQAPALEIARLSRVGLRLAKTIVSDRNAHGPFGSLSALDRVPGIGPGLLATVKDQVRFSAPPQAVATSSPVPVERSTGDRGRGTGDRLNLNTASAEDLERLPKVGPSLAARIVAFRQKHGPFTTVDSLVRVPGIGPATVARLRDHVRAE